MTPTTEERLVSALEKWLKQDRASRRWRNLLLFAISAYILVLIVFMVKGANELSVDELESRPYAAIVPLKGAIMPNSDTASANAIMPLLRQAFADKQARAVIIEANSPGGAPVQAALIHDEILRLKKKTKKPVYVVVQDLCASGCYYAAVAADKIYANENSIVGSIGVRLDSFGFTGLMDKLGIENRSMYAGEHKAFINPFGPRDEEGREYFRQHVLERTHQNFINAVKKGRESRLKTDDPMLFTGMVWLADEAIRKGLIDGLADTRHVVEDVLNLKHMHRLEIEKPLLQKLLQGAQLQSLTGALLKMQPFE